MPDGLVEVGARVECAVLHVLGHHAVKLVGSRVDDHVAYRSDRPPQLGVIVAGRDVDGLDGLYRRNQDLQESGPLIVVDAFDLIAVPLAWLPVHLRLNRTRRIEELRVLEDRRPNARHQREQRLEVLIHRNRHVLESVGFKVRAYVGAVGLQDCWCRGDRHSLRRAAGLQSQVDARRRIDHDIDAGPRFLLEPLRRHHYRVRSRCQIGKRIVAALIRRRAAADAGCCFGDRDLRPGHTCSRRVGYRAHQGCRNRLCMRPRSERPCQHKQQYRQQSREALEPAGRRV